MLDHQHTDFTRFLFEWERQEKIHRAIRRFPENSETGIFAGTPLPYRPPGGHNRSHQSLTGNHAHLPDRSRIEPNRSLEDQFIGRFVVQIDGTNRRSQMPATNATVRWRKFSIFSLPVTKAERSLKSQSMFSRFSLFPSPVLFPFSDSLMDFILRSCDKILFAHCLFQLCECLRIFIAEQSIACPVPPSKFPMA
jgi:hypothetical protein